MALVIYWYDIVCFGIVAASLGVSFWVVWRRELASKCDDNIIYQSLLVARPDITDRTVVPAMPGNHVGSSQLWTSCWKQVHPGWLLATRSISFLVMAGLLWKDIVDWDATIFIYYTEWTFMLIMIYFALGTVMDEEEDGTATSITYKEKKSEGTIKSGTHCAEEAIRERAGFWGYLMQIIYQTCAGAVILTDIIFWCVIVPFLSNSHLGLNALMGCMHSLNAVFLLIDTALNSLRGGASTKLFLQVKNIAALIDRRGHFLGSASHILFSGAASMSFSSGLFTHVVLRGGHIHSSSLTHLGLLYGILLWLQFTFLVMEYIH
ncbi:hypothetical protein OIU77_024527 [Salix suchowensis]|uniref:Uncharacterized protein n=1 Tax=Salix suchowensis TaxID=1278906 RepID=A0ABQ9BT23_9ROSI|nr:hypothetical protein OIU77_024527 [Salix suchowensis]